MRVSTVSFVVALQASLSLAAAYPPSISRPSLSTRPVSDRVSVGVTYEEIERGVDFDKGPDSVLKANSLSLYVGYDVVPWVTAFATIGGSELDGTTEINTDAGLKLSAGVSMCVWDADILEPIYMAGRLTLRPMAEISRYASDSDLGEVTWIDATLALPLGYERFDRYPVSAHGIATSLALYAGPAVSYIQGSADTNIGKIDFEADTLLGVMGGVDVYLSPGVALGVAFSVFDETTLSASLRFHL